MFLTVQQHYDLTVLTACCVCTVGSETPSSQHFENEQEKQ